MQSSTSPLTAPAPWYVFYVELLGFVLGVTALFWLGHWCLSALRVNPTPLWLWAALPLAAGLGLALADLVSGLVHWAFDTLGSPETPFWGPVFIKPFRDHHTDPLGITRHGFISNVGTTGLGAFPFVAGLQLLVLPAPQSVAPVWVLAVLGIWVFVAFSLLTNQIHRWAHEPRAQVPAVIRAIQRTGLILSAPHHQRHHTAPYDDCYCITTGWSEPLLRWVIRQLRPAAAAAQTTAG
jgi:ubiquitin-conjugating enzyme E2 variant